MVSLQIVLLKRGGASCFLSNLDHVGLPGYLEKR